MVTIHRSADGLSAAQLDGFFVGWPDPPSPSTHLLMLRSAFAVAIAVDDGRAVGFANAISDGVLSAFIPLLEVLPERQGEGIGTALVRDLCAQLEHLYIVDLVCDRDLQPFYEDLGFLPLVGMARRNHANQSGVAPARS